MTMRRCIIIEDEFPAIELLKGYINTLTHWDMIASFTNAIDALNFINDNEVDLIFLDIELPKLNGINFIKALEDPPLIVITSAYSDHAVEAFDLLVFDYLLKPFSFERFVKSISRADKKLAISNTDIPLKEESIKILVNRENVTIQPEKIIYIESQKEYVNIVCDHKNYKTKIGIGKMERLLNANDFIRVHRSFIVAKSYIDSYSSSNINISTYRIPIGRSYKNEVFKAIGE